MTARTLPEWRGATPDSPVPDRVKVRVFARYDGYCNAVPPVQQHIGR